MGGSGDKRRVVIRNKKARHDYHILETFEAGVVLLGAEVKSLREGKASFADPFARVEDGEVWMYNLHITPYAAATIDPPEPTRKRKLLMQRRQIAKLASRTAERGLTLVPLDLYFTPRGLAKVTLGLAKGKRAHDRRETLKRDEAKREMERAVKRLAVLIAAGTLMWPRMARAQDALEGVLSLASASVSELALDQRFGYPAISLEDFRRLGFADVEARAGVVTAVVGGDALELYVGSPFYRFRRTVRQLPNPPYQAEGTYWVPVSLVTGQATGRGRPAGSGASASAVASATGGDSGPAAEPAPAPRRPPRPLRVVIDPGHGGRDPGTIGRRGTREKDVVLAIGKMVHAKLSAMSGVEPMLTRDRDVLIPLKKRSQLAVAQEADLFLSIHANASRNRRAEGFETYFLGKARTELSRELAMRENSAVQYEEEGEAMRPEDVQFILAQLNLTSNQRESGTFGGYVQNSLRGVLRTPDRGVKQNGLWVLVGATGSMPSILVEVGFLSNDREEKLLRSKAGQQQVADAIVDAIIAYRDDYAPRLQAAGAR